MLFTYKITDYKAWAKGLKKAGYATNPKYPKLLIDLIERYNLVQYDKISESEYKKMLILAGIATSTPIKKDSVVSQASNNVAIVPTETSKSLKKAICMCCKHPDIS